MRFAGILLIAGSLAAQGPKPALLSFPTPEAAAEAAIQAAEKNDVAQLNAIFGANSKAILTSGDSKQDQEERAQFARTARAAHHLEKDPMNRHRMILDVGPEDWPFPVPIVETAGKWSFSALQGDLEVRARRIGANELDTVEMCAAIAQAQQQYATVDRDGDGILEFAGRIMSTPGKQDGLYSEKEALVPRIFAEAEVRVPGAPAKPFHGYYFRVLKGQGPNAPGGAHDFFIRERHMMGGFAVVAWPAAYGTTGIRTFLLGQDGVVYEKDLHGAPVPSRFDPDKTWLRVD